MVPAGKDPDGIDDDGEPDESVEEVKELEERGKEALAQAWPHVLVLWKP